MKQILLQGGRAVVRETSVPDCGPGQVLVEVHHSVISTGTETSTLDHSRRRPEGVWGRRLRKLLALAPAAARRGPGFVLENVRDRLGGACWPTGYSVAGRVLQVGTEVPDLVPGQWVAAAGAEWAHHAEIIRAPRLLVAPLPEGVDTARGAFATLGAIALQGVRRASPELGEVGLVVGLGLLGHLTSALVRAAGCRVLGLDPDPTRRESARAMGVDEAWDPQDPGLDRALAGVTGGHGPDFAILTAATPSHEPVRQAARAIRRRGRIVVVGDVGLHLERGPLYEKELDLRLSHSYGPGRSDPAYEREGRDYPFAFVRWTENRNLEAFLSLLAQGRVDLDPLDVQEYPLGDADEAFRTVSGSTGPRPLAALLRYPAAEGREAAVRLEEASFRAPRTVRSEPRPAPLGVALVGAGGFAREVLLPALEQEDRLARLLWVVSGEPHRALETARRFGAVRVAGDLSEVLEDPEVHLVVVASRHHLHAEQATRALRAGKAVYLEKPAALDEASLAELEAAWRETGLPLTVGFNRRFARDARTLKHRLEKRSGPVVLRYLVRAPRLPLDHWVYGPEGGGRLLGEACHMVDLLRFLAGSPIEAASARPLGVPPGRSDLRLGDNVVAVLSHRDGSLSELTYTSLGDPSWGKERIEAHGDGVSMELDDFRRLVEAPGLPPAEAAEVDKGHGALMHAFLRHAAGEAPPPIPPEEIFEVSRWMLKLDRELRRLPEAETP